MKFLFTVMIFLMGQVFYACADSDDYLVDDNQVRSIQVEAFISKSLDENSPREKQDTLEIGDSVFFISNIRPSRTIPSQDYYWTMDGALFAQEFNFRKAIYEPGLHKIVFTFVDNLGDSASDTLSVYAASKPILDNQHFVPSSNTKGLESDKVIRFAWNAYDPDSIWNIEYHFTLREAAESGTSRERTIIDTLLSSNIFTLNQKLKGLTKYTWSVSAQNELQLSSKASLNASFFTGGISGEGGFIAEVYTSSKNIPSEITLNLYDKANDTTKILKNVPINPESGTFSIKPLAAGSYSFTVSAEDYPDFQSDTIRLDIFENQVLELDTLFLQDTVPPTILSLDLKDSIEIADTLRFIIKDGGGSIGLIKTFVTIDGFEVEDFSIEDDTLFIPLNIQQSWALKALDVTSTDLSGNKTSRSFYLKPNSLLHEVFQ